MRPQVFGMATRVAVVDRDLCNPRKCALECIGYCPVNRNGKECIALSEGKDIAVLSEELCSGCGICVKVCPFHAIDVVNLVARVEEKLIYSYGRNGFDLYGVALPRKGIIGIVGENGCGKTTNVKLITGTAKPKNLFSKEVKEHFASADFKRVAVKPQELSSKLKGKVGALLKRIDEAGRLKGLRQALDLDDLATRDFGELSGGELQRVVIAAVLCRDKDVFVLDEPFAFLDYAYRIRLAQYLREHLAEKQVLVVEHDLSLMSYLCDCAYILFGAPGAYGIVSQPYATDRAVNMFLEGFIEPENIRFRGAIKYKRFESERRQNPVASIPPLEVARGSFKLSNCRDIPLFEGEVVGVAGPNGTGKSTLLTELKKVFESASLKPQLLERSDEPVASFLSADSPFKESFVRQMNLQRLEWLPLRKLSGGELQKAELFRALARDSALYLLDEPTNMMDVPGRIALSKLLKEKAVTDCCTVVVVDHDLEFLLNTVDRLVVFGGEPARRGVVEGVFGKDEGVRLLLSRFELSYRRDGETNRLKLNKQGSVKDRELKQTGKFVE